MVGSLKTGNLWIHGHCVHHSKVQRLRQRSMFSLFTRQKSCFKQLRSWIIEKKNVKPWPLQCFASSESSGYWRAILFDSVREFAPTKSQANTILQHPSREQVHGTLTSTHKDAKQKMQCMMYAVCMHAFLVLVSPTSKEIPEMSGIWLFLSHLLGWCHQENPVQKRHIHRGGLLLLTVASDGCMCVCVKVHLWQ